MADNNDQGDVPSWATGLADFSAAPPAAAPDDTSFKPSNYLVKPDVAPVVPEKEEDPLSKMLSEAEQTNSLPPKQFYPDGSAIPGTSAAFKGETAHPLSIAVMKSYDLVDEVDRDRFKISEAIATALGVKYQEDIESGKTIKTYLNMTPQAVDQLDDATRERLKARPDVKRLMNQESMTRTMLAEDNEKVAILAGYIPLVSAAEGALKTALRFNADVKGTSASAFDRSFGITELPEVGDFGAGTASINAVKRMENRFLNAFTGTLALARAMNAIEFESDLVAATTIAPIPQTPKDLKKAQELFSENVDIMKKGTRILNHPDVRKLMKELSVLDIENIEDPAVWAKAMGIVANNPVGWQMLAVEQTIENAPLLVVSAAMTALGGPALGIAASTAGESWQEAFLMTPERIAMVKEKFGHDMYTVKGVEAFVKDQAALAAYAEWGVKRAVPIAVMNVVGLGALAKIHKVLKMSKTAQLAAGTVTEMITEGLGEAGAMKLTEGKVKISQVLLEALGAGNPGSTAIRMYTAVGSDASEKLSKVRAERWLKAGGEMAQSLNGIPESKISTAAEILSERMRADGVDTVYIQADELLRFDQDESVINTLGLTSEAVRTAARDGNDVAIDTATYIRHILGKTGFEALIRHTRFEDTIMTGAEAEQYVSATDGVSIKDQLTKEAMSRIAPGVDEKTLADMSTSGGLIREQVAQQLEATGKYTAGQSALYGQLTEQRYITRSVRMLEKTGKYVSPMDLIIKDNLRIQGSDTRTGVARSPEFDQLLKQQAFNQEFVGTGTVKVTPAEQAFFDEVLGNEVNRAELLEAVPSLAVKDGSLSVAAEDIDAFLSAMNDFVISDGAISVPPRLRALTSSRDIVSKMEFNQTAKEFNVTPEQLKAELEAAGGDITQTPAFKAWFGDSKVVDADGKPLVVYHGTLGDFGEFLRFSWFTANPDEASGYAFTGDALRRDRLDRRLTLGKGAEQYGGQEIEMYDRYNDVFEMRDNPVVGQLYGGDIDGFVARYDGKGKFTLFTDLTVGATVEGVSIDENPRSIADATDSDYVRSQAEGVLERHKQSVAESYPRGQGGKVLPVYLSIQNPKRVSALEFNELSERLGSTRGRMDEVIDALVAEGYDGLVTESDEAATNPEVAEALGGVPVQYVAFNPAQIKSTFNRGTFDPNDPMVLNQDAADPTAKRKGAENVGKFTADMDATGFATVYGSVEVIRAALPNGIRGTIVPDGVRFTPNFSPRVIAFLRGDETAFSRGGKIVEAQVRDGKFVGASQLNNTPESREEWRKTFSQLALEGERGRFWYENSGAAVLEMTGGDIKEAKKFIALLAIYSPQAKVASNATFALRAWAQYKAGQPIKVKTADQDTKANNILYKGEPWGGEKINNFYINLLRQVDPSVAGKQGATIDMWMMHAGGYNKTAANSSEYAFMENETNILAKELGWEPQQVQAAVWVAIKARMENDQVKKDTEKSSEKAGWITYKKDRKGKLKRFVKNETKHFENWFQHGLRHKLTKQDTDQAKFDFSDGLVRHTGQISWEAIPSTSADVLPGIFNAPYKQKVEFQNAIKEALSTVTGEDILAQYLGILADGSILAPGSWMGAVSPSGQNIVAMAPAAAGFMYYNTKNPDAAPLTDSEFKALGKVQKRPYEKRASIDPAQKQVLDLYVNALALVLRQDGVGYHKPFFATSIKAANGVDFDIDRQITAVQMKKLNIEFRKIMNAEGLADWDDHVALVSSPTGVRIIKITDAFMDNVKLHDVAKRAFSAANVDDTVSVKYFAADGSLAYNNWKENPNGEDFIRGISATGRSDVLEWVRDVLAPRVDGVYEEFSSRYGWGEVAPITFEQSGREARLGSRQEGRGSTPLQGAPSHEGATGPIPGIVAAAERYAQQVGIPLRRQGEFVQINEAFAARISDAYTDMKHDPNNPAVKEAYQDLISQVRDQYDILVEEGYTFSFFDAETDPYDGNPWGAMRDLKENKSMAVYGTYDGYGMEGVTAAAVADNPMLADTGLTWIDQNGEERAVTANDLFRAVHDAFGHGMEGAGFRARGEENAWQAHARLFTGPALGALTSETRGQNSWVNFGPNGEANETSTVENTVFAEQKTGLMPEWTWLEGRAKDEAEPGQAPDLSQGEAKAPRGGFTPSDLINDQEGNPVNLIQIFEGADPSTFLHESGHFWLEMLKADAEEVGGGFMDDWQGVVKWWGQRSLEIKDEAIRRAKKKEDKAAVAVLEKMTDAQVKAYIRKGDLRGSSDPAARYLSVSMHEQFARGTETYFATGKAPSIALTSIFNSFKVWLLSVYNKMRGTDVKFSEDVSAIMDRMLATDEEIAAMAGQYQLASIFDSAETMGVSKEEFAAHQKKVADAKSRSAAEQLAKHLRDLRMEKTDWWNEEREGMREDVTKRFAEKPAYRVMAAIFHGGRYDGSTIPNSEKLPRMNREALEEALDDEGMTLATMPKDGSKVIYMPGKEGSDPAIVAATFGYEDVSAMLKDLSARPDFEGAVNAELDRMMHDKHSVMTTALETESLASIHGDHHAGVMAAELHALRTVEPAFKPAFIKQYAMDQIMEMPLKDIKPHLFVLAEKRHAGLAKKALAKGDRAEAYRHQFQRLINHRKAEAALKVQKDVEKKTKALRKLQKATKMPSVDAKYAAKIKDILNAVDFSRPLSERTKLKEELKAINDFIAQSLEDDGAILRVPEIISRAEGLKNTDDMTYSEYLEMSGFVFTLERQGKLAKKLRVGKENRDREEVKLELLSKLDKIGDTFVSMLSADAMGPRMAAKGAAVSGLSFVMSLDSSLLKTESLMESIDGEPLGPWHQTIYQPIADAYWEKARLTKEVTARVTELIKALPKEVQKSMNKTVDVGGLGFPGGKMKRSALIMMALNMGTESNMDKLIRGYGGDKKTKVRGLGWNINEDLINGALDNLTKEEWDLVQAIWTEAEALWPEVANIMAEENGLPPERLEHRTVKTKFGDIAGGYFPMIYDYDVVYDSSLNNIEKKKILEAMKGNAGLGGVDIGSTKSRTGFAAPVSLDFSNLTRGLEDTIHIITHYEAGRNVRKILNDGDIQIQLKTKVGPEYANDLELWLSAAISNGAGTPPLNAWQKAGQFLINNTTMSFLGFSYSTLGMQTIGLTSSLDRLMADKTYGPITAAEMTARLSHGLTMAVVPENYRFVTQSSPFMASRIEEYNDEARRIIKESQKTFSVNSPFIWGMKAIAVAQYLAVDVPTWTAAYNIATTNEDKNDPRIHAKAVKYADRVVRLSQSSGGKVDLSRWQREATGMNKMFNMFYTWFSALYAVEREMGREFGQNMPKKPVGAIGRLMSRMLILFVVSSVGAGLVRGELPDWEPEDEDEQGLAAYLAVQSASTALGSIPYVRETSGVLTGFGFKLAGATFLEQFSKVANEIVKNIADDEEAVDWDDKSAQELAKKAKPWVLLGGSLTGAPSTLINRFLSGYSAYKDDAPNWEPIDLIRGYNKDLAAKR